MPPGNSPLTGIWTLHPNNEESNTPQITYTPDEQRYLNFRKQRLISARDSRDSARDEWDGMPYLSYFDILKKADDQFVAPRKNKQDTSINLGTIRDKDTSMVEYAMSHDFEPVAIVHDDEGDTFDEMAEAGEDMVRKSFTLDQWRDKSKLTYRSMVSFGTALVQERYVQRWVINKTLKEGFKAGMGSDQASWEQHMKLQFDGCQSLLWDQRKCYPGDIRKFFMNGVDGQPYFFTVRYESYDMMKQMYGNWDRWIYVPNYIVATPEVSSPLVFTPWWTLRPVSMNYVEEICYYDPIANEFAITLNGVDMLPLMKRQTKDLAGNPKTEISGFPLTEVSPSGLIPFAKYDFEPMHDFFYSKAQPAKMRVSADVENMLYKLFLLMLKQKARPTMGNKSGRQFGDELTEPGQIINDIREEDIFPVLGAGYTGATPADFSFFELTKKELDKNSVERSWQGMSPTQQDDTATKDLNDQKQQTTLKVAAMFDGIISGNKQLYFLRMANIMKNWTKPIDSQVDTERKQLVNMYRTISVPAESHGGEKVGKKIIFTKDTPKLKKGKKRASLDDSFNILDQEQEYKKEYGNDVRIILMHPELFATMPMHWYFESVPVPNSNDPLSYMVFAKQIQDAMTFFGPQSMNVKKLKHRFAQLTGTDFDTWFLNEQEMALQAAQQPPTNGQPAQGGNPTQPTTPGVIPGKSTANGPSIASVMASKQPASAMGSLLR